MIQNVVIGVVIVVTAIYLFLAIAAVKRVRSACPKCYRSPRRCECEPMCRHAYGPTTWTQDGWVKVCKFCRDWVYLGDDYDGGPRQ